MQLTIAAITCQSLSNLSNYLICDYFLTSSKRTLLIK